jgi:hypothetical protein
MADDDLTTIPGLVEKHRKVLADQLQVTTYEALVHADRQSVFDAMFRVRPRPTLSEIGEWQNDAQRQLTRGTQGLPTSADETSTDVGLWTQAATFVVSFEERRLEHRVERRLVVEQTELEPEQAPSVWPDWDCSKICGWMVDRLDRTDPTPSEGEALDNKRGAELGQRPSVTRTRPDRPQLSIEQAAVIDVTGRADVVTEGTLISTVALGCTLPGRLAVTVAGVDVDRDVEVALRLRRLAEPGSSTQQQVSVRSGHPTEIELSSVAVGQYNMTLATWTPDGSADPVVMRLGTFTIRAQAAADPGLSS